MLSVLWCLAGQILVFIGWLLFGCGGISGWAATSMLIGILGQVILECDFDTRLIKSKSIEEFCTKQKKVYIASILLDLSMLQVIGHYCLGRKTPFILHIIVWLYIIWVMHLLLRDILSLMDIKSIKTIGYASKRKVITANIINRRLINNKYTIWYMKDDAKRIKEVHKKFKQGAKYEVEIIKGHIGEYIVDYKIKGEKKDG